MRDADPIGIYIHWPFCLAKCPYCDFNSHVAEAAPDAARWQAALLRELETLAQRAGERHLVSIFFGGGTPSLMPPGTVAALIARIQSLWMSPTPPEITLEANPTSSEAMRFRAFAEAGVNRLSLGVQALNDRDLKRLGRRHSADEALEALKIAKRVFPRLSFDLIYARMEQSAEAWTEELRQALQLAKGHISLYQLTLEEGTAFYDAAREGRMKLPEEGLADALFAITQEICEEAGLPAYEISNHAAPGEESRHNLNYWRGGEYLGVGPGAHSRLAGRALATEAEPERWLARVEADGHGLVADAALSPLEQAEERLLMGLRLREGVDLAALAALSGHHIPEPVTAPYIADGYLETAGQNLRVTSKGRFVLNRLTAELAAGLASKA